ncbi:T9SS type A sorting domain-containing protein [Chryseolinea lacunae]|uniref:T9SS type A sorting domain-containing protein n=1 Tax=Chryseolinea lacunae TaxID=2801331 RepID=A0ABS1KY21_9BACT|nr:T9SS type A sorting domain-containing protein [Chryseolinea lacunae]MBL0744341.1 T9SS type A sorting domain-containing protein [Chryseolinea lacunae]
MEITPTGILTISSSSNIYSNSLILDGTVNGGSSGDLRISNSGPSTLSGVGSYSNTNTNSYIRLQNNTTILAGSDIKFTNNSRFSLNGRTATNNGKISILNPSNFTGGGTFVNAASTSYLLYTRLGSFPTGTTLTATATGNTVEYRPANGSRNMDAQSSYYNLIIGGSGATGVSRIIRTTTTIRGNLTINASATLDIYQGTNINIAGNWSNSGNFTERTSLVTFNGSLNNQTVTAEQFYDLTINNSFAGGTVTANGNITITSGRTLRMTAGVFDMGTFTLGQTGAARLTATGGELRLGKTGTTLPELTGTYNITGGTITFSGAGNQTVRSLNAPPSSYYNISFINAGTKTLGGDINVRGNWTNTGPSVAGNFTTTFGGTGVQTITNAAGELFYRVTVNTTGPLTLASSTDATISNTLTLTSGNINLNGKTLTVGNGAAATLVRTTGTAYGGFFRRYFPTVAISSTAAPLYGLFPVGTALAYRPVQINSTSNPTTAGYVTVSHNDANTATDVAYTDNESTPIQRVTDMNSVVSTTTLAGGTYTLSVTMNSLSNQGTVADLRMETLAGPPYGVGTTVATTGTPAAPTVIRSGLSVTQLNNSFVIGTRDRSATPMVASYYSRKSSTWNDATTGNSTWSLTRGGVSCNCVPIASSIVYITAGTTVRLSSAASTDFVFVESGGNLTATGGTFTVNYDLSTQGTGRITPTGGTWGVTRNMTISGTSVSSSSAPLTIGGNLQIDAGNSLTMGNTLSVAGDLEVDGTLAMGGSTLTLSGVNTTITGVTGAATISGTGAINVTQSKTIQNTADITIGPNINLSAGMTITNGGTVTHTGSLTGGSATSTWVNDVNAVYNVTGAVMTTGVLNASASPNTVNYNGGGAQTVKVPLSSYYDLQISNAGTKTTGGDIVVDNSLTIQDAAIFDMLTSTLNGAGDLIMTGTSELAIGKTASGTYPELAGAYALSGGTVTLKQAAGNTYDVRLVDYYNLQLTGSNAATYNFTNGGNVTNNLTVALAGTAKIGSLGAPLNVANDFVFNSSSTATSTLDNDAIVGTLTMTAGRLTTSGTFTLEINGAGGWTYNGGTFTQGATTNMLFSGAADQAMDGALPTTITNLELNNSGPLGVVLGQDITVTGTLTFTSGNLVTSGANLLLLSATSSITGVSDDSYVEGPMQKAGATDFTFPVGKDGAYRPITATSLTATGTFQAEYFHSDPTALYNTALKDPTLVRVQTGEYWILNVISGITSAFVTLSWDAYSGTVNDLSSIKVARWNGSMWKDHGTAGVTGSASPATGTVTSSAKVTAFSPFTLATGNNNNPLPVTLVSFTAKLLSGEVELDWNTATEVDNDYFTVEKTKDTKKYSEVLRVKGSGTTSMASHYGGFDKTPYSGISYYRLRQTDFDGKTVDIGIVAVNNSGGSENQTLLVFPNPARSVPLNVNLRGYGANEDVTLDLRDIKGLSILSKVLTTENTGELIYAIDTTSITPGVYILTVRGSHGPASVKVVVQ